jgi:undecaprenyl-diphosphatase
MNIIHALILGIIEGLTEFLPISSTAHLMIANRLLFITATDFVKSFDIFIQLGAILAVLLLYIRRLFFDRPTFLKIIVAFIPTAIIGLLLYPFVKNNLLGNLKIAAFALILGGVIMIIFEYTKQSKKSAEPISYLRALGIGIFQSLAIIPGVSRAGATIIGGQSLGVDRKTIVEFSFLLAIPTMAAASGLDLLKSNFSFTSSEWLLLSIGFISAFLTALLAVRFFLRYIKKHSFIAFGWYRIIIGIAILLWII